MTVPDTQACVLSVMILIVSYTNNNSYQVLSIHYTLYIYDHIFFSQPFQVDLFFQFCKEKIEAQEILNVLYCISNSQKNEMCTCPDRKHEIYLEIALKNSTIVWKIGEQKNQVRILISEGKKERKRKTKRALLVTGTKPRWAQGDEYVDYSGVALLCVSQSRTQQHISASHL